MHLMVSQNISGAVKHFLQYCDEAYLFVQIELLRDLSKKRNLFKQNLTSDTQLKMATCSYNEHTTP